MVKRINKKRVRNPTTVLSEVHIMGRLDHPHVVKLYDTYEDSDSLCLVMEYFSAHSVYAGAANSTNA